MCNHIVFTFTFRSTNKTSNDPVYISGEEGKKMTEEVARHYSIGREAKKGFPQLSLKVKADPGKVTQTGGIYTMQATFSLLDMYD